MNVGDLAPVWSQLVCLAAAFALSSAVGLERQIRQKSAGLRTHTLVGLGAALFMIVSKFGFTDVLVEGTVRLDPSRVAAQIVSGIGFLGAGVVFTRRSRVRGLTTAASIWLTAAVGTAAGAGLILHAAFATAAYFVVTVLYPYVVDYFSIGGQGEFTVRVDYIDRVGVLREILSTCTKTGSAVAGFSTHDSPDTSTRFAAEHPVTDKLVEVQLDLLGTPDIGRLMAALSQTQGVVAVSGSDESE